MLMKEPTSTRMSGFGRRRFVKTLSSIGVSAAAIRSLTPTTLAKLTEKPRQEVPRVKAYRHTNHEQVVNEGVRPEREPIHYTIPRDEWAITESAHDARRSIAQLINQQFETDLKVAVETGQHGEKQIRVFYPRNSQTGFSVNELRDALPDRTNGVAGKGGMDPITVEDIPVLIDEVGEKQYYYYYDRQYRPVPGGATYENGSYQHCTIGTPAYDNKKDVQSWVTAGHCFDDNESLVQNTWDTATELQGKVARNVFQNRSHGNMLDGCVVTPQNGTDTKYDLAARDSDGYQGVGISGALSKDYVKDMEGTDEQLNKQGATTANGYSTVGGVAGTEFYTTHDIQKGDSGGPVYKVTTGSFSQTADIAGIISHSHSDDTKKWHTFMTDLERELDVTI